MIRKILSLVVPVCLFASCATILSGTYAKVSVSSPDASQANLRVDGERYDNVILPTEVRVKRGFNPSIIEAETYDMEGSVTVEKSFNAVSLGNILIGGIVGYVVDVADGAVMKPKKNQYEIRLNFKDVPGFKDAVRPPLAQPITTQASTVVTEVKDSESQEIVSRNNPGSSNLERTIIRWYFDSEPRGARIFWRVVSSVPDEVKNTNELYLGTTPFEETKSFTILGLTYNNANNVQIEVKLTRPGYMDQIKRFNVRQAIDQQEISAFFDLVVK